MLPSGNGVSLFHEAGVWAGSAQGSSGDVYITSNIVEDGDALEIKICRIRLDGDRSNSDGELRLSVRDLATVSLILKLIICPPEQ